MKMLPWNYGVRNLGRSPVRTGLCIGSAMLISLIAIGASGVIGGLERSLKTEIPPDVAVVFGAGSEDSLERSDIDARTASLIAASVPGIRSIDDMEYISPEVIMAVSLDMDDQKRPVLALARGMTESAFLLHKNVQIIKGRAPIAGRNEIMVGELAPVKMGLEPARLEVGSSLQFDGIDWKIVGQFVAPGSMHGSEIWIPLSDLMVATKRQGLSAVYVEMDPGSGGEIGDLESFAFKRLDLELIAIPLKEYYERLDEFYGPIKLVVWATAILIAIGTCFAGINTMYAAFAGRIREFAMLRCLGWRPIAIGISLVQETIVSSAAGALLGCALGLLVLDGMQVRFTMGAFKLLVGPEQLLLALCAGIGIAVIGVIPPAMRCLGKPLNESLKSM